MSQKLRIVNQKFNEIKKRNHSTYSKTVKETIKIDTSKIR